MMALPKVVNEVIEKLDGMGMDNNSVCIMILQLRKPTRAKAMLEYLEKNPEATQEEIMEKAAEITVTVDPTLRHPRETH